MNTPPVDTEDLPPGTVSTGRHQVLEMQKAERQSRPGFRWRRWLLRAAGLLVLVSTVYVAVTFIQVWRASSDDGTEMSDAIVVLGAAQYDGRPSPVLEARLQRGRELFMDGLAPYIVVTGGRQDGDTYTEATSGYNWLVDRGVPDEAILKEVQGRTTYESLAATARFLRERDLDEVLLVTDGYHALRARGIASDVGLVPHVSTVDGDGATVMPLARETVAVSVGRIIGYRRLDNLMG